MVASSPSRADRLSASDREQREAQCSVYLRQREGRKHHFDEEELNQTGLCVNINIPGLKTFISTASSFLSLSLLPLQIAAPLFSRSRSWEQRCCSSGSERNSCSVSESLQEARERGRGGEERDPVASDDSAALTPEMMTRQKSWGPGKKPRGGKNTEKVQNNHSGENMAGGVTEHGGCVI